MKKLVIIPIMFSMLWMAGCSSANASGPAGEQSQLSTWVRFKAALSARLGGGKSAIQKANAAKSAVKSYKMRIEMRLHPGDPFVTEEAVSCPDRLRMSASLGDRPMYEAYRIADTSYVKDEQNNWVKSPIPKDVFPCGDKPGGAAPWAILNEGRDMTSALAQLVNDKKANANVSVGNLVAMNGGACQEWDVAFGHPGKNPGAASNSSMFYTICIDTETHLPAKVVMGTGGIVVKYYDWNQPVNIDVPTT